MLKVAVPNKGALAEAAALMLTEAGYRQRRSSRDLVTIDPDNEVEFFYLRPRDIAIYVGEGTLDVCLTGRDLLDIILARVIWLNRRRRWEDHVA